MFMQFYLEEDPSSVCSVAADDMSFDGFIAIVQSSFPDFTSFQFSYVDDENDIVQFSSAAEFREVVKLAGAVKGILSICVTGKMNPIDQNKETTEHNCKLSHHCHGPGSPKHHPPR
eukprot:CAMPEP_0185023988 /NCGR_PEP_ID=MMETSP1103-20130426/6851_1 /TAXON_ID=36769 /ORGANISM="Paraphysomonas bandaiensis, Strain Caron Lab Isolate" /LENGTH=115 /DNA_ID=CAMNT_0027556815 /DNA_START=70 /DNA_END=414 /DNA_ORIENTATION=+